MGYSHKYSLARSADHKFAKLKIGHPAIGGHGNQHAIDFDICAERGEDLARVQLHADDSSICSKEALAVRTVRHKPDVPCLKHIVNKANANRTQVQAKFDIIEGTE